MKKTIKILLVSISALLLLTILGLGGFYLYSRHVMNKAMPMMIDMANHQKPYQICLGSRTQDRPPLCQNFTFEAFNKENLNSVMSDDLPPHASPFQPSTLVNEPPHHVQYAGDDIVSPVVFQNVTVHARTPLECVHDKECAWYAFYKTFAPQGKILGRWNNIRRYKILGGTPELQSEVRDFIKRFSRFEEYKEGDAGKANFIIILSTDFGRDFRETYHDYFVKNVENSGIFYESFKQLNA